MRSLLRIAGVIVVVSVATGCGGAGLFSSVHEYQPSGYASVRTAGAPIETVPIVAESKQTVLLGIADNTDYVNQAYDDLLRQCPGEVIGLNTRVSTALGFLSYTNHLHIEALCVK